MVICSDVFVLWSTTVLMVKTLVLLGSRLLIAVSVRVASGLGYILSSLVVVTIAALGQCRKVPCGRLGCYRL